MTSTPNEYLILSRGQWDEALPPERIQQAIDDFYAWHDRLVAEGRMKPGQRLAPECKTVSKLGITDGPYTEAKEIIGGYWFVYAHSLDEAAAISTGNPCIACGLFFDVRPIEPVKASAFATTCETPAARGDGRSAAKA